MISGFPILMQDKKKIVLIPKSHDEKGLPVFFDGAVTLSAPFDNATIGRKVREMIKLCEATPLLSVGRDEDILEEATGCKNGDSKELNEAGWKWASVMNMPGPGKNEPSKIKEKGIEVSVQKFRHGGFIGFTSDPSFPLPLDCSDEELGETVLKAFASIETM